MSAWLGWATAAVFAANSLMTQWFLRRAFARCDSYEKLCQRYRALLDRRRLPVGSYERPGSEL